MADAMLTREAVERRRVALATGSADGALRPLVRSATDVGRALGQLMMPVSDHESAALADARQALVGLGDLALGCPAGSRDDQRFLGWIGEVVERVRNTPRGRTLLLPGGWCTKSGGHPMVYAVRRMESGHFSFAVTNAGDGLEYHPVEADPALDGFRAMHTILLEDVDPGALADASAWALLYRPLVYPAPGKKQSEIIYAKVLPFLNRRPLMASVGKRAGVGEGGYSLPRDPLRPRARGGDASGARLALEAARHCVATAPGVTPERADALVEMGVRHVLLETALQDLGQVPGERLAAAPAAALECACRSLSAAAGPHADALADASEHLAKLAGPPGEAPVRGDRRGFAGGSVRRGARRLRRRGAAAAAAMGAANALAPPPKPALDPFAPSVSASLPGGARAPAVEAETLARIIRCVEAVFQRVAALRRPALLPPPLLELAAPMFSRAGDAASSPDASALPDTSSPATACSAPLFGRLAPENDGGEAAIEALAGSASAPPIVRPVELTLVPDAVADVGEASAALRAAVHCCVLLANQSDLLPNTFTLRVSLLTHLFCGVLPAPLPLDHPERRERCFWASEKGVRYETQAEILRNLRLLLSHFTAASLSISATRSFDANRLLSLASLASIADAVLRLRVADHPSPFCEHYAGDADGPVRPFGFEMGPFVVEAEFLRFHCPERTARLTQTLDYFHGMRKVVNPDTHAVFRWETGSGFGRGEERLLSQVCLQMGFPMGREELPFYLSGESREFSDNYPEMSTMRDIVFAFKAFMTPTSDALPELRRWRPRDAGLWWKYKPGEGFQVHAVGRRLEVAPWKEGDSGEKGLGWRSALGGGFLARLFGGGDSRPRCPPSGGNPSNLAGARVDTEEDVLHLADLPTFDGLLRPSESELLLTYLTAPYLRIPLVLRHFADPQRVRALGHAEIQGVLDACFFEPGPWQPPGSIDVPAEVPAPSRAHMATPAGLLLHELANAPAPLVDAAEEILALSLELDTGRHDAPVSAGLLYAARLMTRMHAFIRFLLVESGYGNEVDDLIDAEEGGVEGVGAGEDAAAERDDSEGATTRTAIAALSSKKGPGGWAGGSGARGVRAPPGAARPLLHAAARCARRSTTRPPDARRWLAVAVRCGSTRAACALHAHLAYLHWSTPASRVTRRCARTLLTAQAYVLVNHPFADAAEPSEGAGGASKARKTQGEDKGGVDETLGFAPTELFDLFQRQRRAVLAWMDANPALADGALEEVVRVLTLNSAGAEAEAEALERRAAGNAGNPRGGKENKTPFDGLGRNVAATKAKLGKWLEGVAKKVPGRKREEKEKEKGGEGGEGGDANGRESDGADGADDGGDGADGAEEGGASEATDSKRKRAAASGDRRWVQVPGPGGVGRFIPETEAAAAAKAAGVAARPRREVDSDEGGAAAAARGSLADPDADSDPNAPTVTAAAAAAEALAAGMSYADWMRSVTTMAVEMEVNTQLGEFTVRKNRLKALQRSVKDMPDFHAALGATLAAQQSGGDAGGTSFGDPRGAGRGAEVDDTFFSGSSPSLGGLVSAGVDGGGADDDPDGAGYDSDGAASRDGSSGVSDVVVHCAEVRRSEHRLWMRLVGLRHDVQLWDADHRAPSCPFNRRYQPLFTNAQIAAGLAGAAGAVSSLVASVGVAGLAEDERWIAERLDPVAAGPAAGYLAGVELFLPVAKVRGPIAHLAGFAKLPEVGGPERGDEHAAWGFEPGKNLPEGVGDKTGRRVRSTLRRLSGRLGREEEEKTAGRADGGGGPPRPAARAGVPRGELRSAAAPRAGVRLRRRVVSRGHRPGRPPRARGPLRAVPPLRRAPRRGAEFPRRLEAPHREARPAALRPRAPPPRAHPRRNPARVRLLAGRKRRPVRRRDGGGEAPAERDSRAPSAGGRVFFVGGGGFRRAGARRRGRRVRRVRPPDSTRRRRARVGGDRARDARPRGVRPRPARARGPALRAGDAGGETRGGDAAARVFSDAGKESRGGVTVAREIARRGRGARALPRVDVREGGSGSRRRGRPRRDRPAPSSAPS